MKNLINFFFSFDKLLKEKLIIPFFWLAIIVFGLAFFADALSAIRLGPLASIVNFVNWFASLLLALVSIRLLVELAVATFRINDNLSPDKGRSELADIDPILEARKAAEAAAARTRELTKTAGEKAQEVTKNTRESVGEVSASAKARTESIMGKGSVPSNDFEPTPVKTLEPSKATTTVAKKRGRPAGSKNKTTAKAATKPATKTAPKKRGRPAGSKNKTTTKKPTAKKTASRSAPKRRGPKPGYKAPRDEFGNLLKKDGTPRKKPGPKKK